MTRRPILLLAILPGLLPAGAALGFEKSSQGDYERLAYCYGQQVGAANALAENLAQWQRIYPSPTGEQVETVGMAQARASELSTLAKKTAALYEDLDHPNYGVDFVNANAAYEKGYSFWKEYLEIRFVRRVQIPVPDETMGMSRLCWQTIFALEAINKANADKGELVWDE